MKYYKLGKHYAPKVEHNEKSMMKIVWLFYSKPLFKCLQIHYLLLAVRDHPMGGGAGGFIQYLAKRGYLIETNSKGRKI
jgi:hypothetical protein